MKNRNQFLYLPGYARPVDTESKNNRNKKNKNISRGPAWNSMKETQERFQNPRFKDKNNNGEQKQEPERIVWEWSKAALQTVELYKRKFPRVFQALESQGNGYQKFNPRDVCGNDEEFDKLCLWLQQLRTYKLPLVPSSSSTMCRAACQAVQTTSEGQRTKGHANQQIVRMKDVPLHLLFFGDFTGTANEGDIGAGTDQVIDWNLGDRVVNLRSPFVPFGLRGTIVGLHPTTGTVEIIFDTTFIGGNTLHGLCANGRGRVVKWTDLLAVDATNVKAPSLLTKKKKEVSGNVANNFGETKERKMQTTNKQNFKKTNTTNTTTTTRSKKTSKKTSNASNASTAKSATSSETKRAPIPVVKQLLKKGSDQQHLNSLLSNMQTNNDPKKANEQQHLNSLLANANKDPLKKKETAHLNQLLANANQPSAQQQHQQQQQQQMQQQQHQQQQQQQQQYRQPMPNMMMMQGGPMMMPPMMPPMMAAMPQIGMMMPPMPSSSLGPMPSTGGGSLEEVTSTTSVQPTSAKKIPRKKKTAGTTSKGLMMPSSVTKKIKD